MSTNGARDAVPEFTESPALCHRHGLLDSEGNCGLCQEEEGLSATTEASPQSAPAAASTPSRSTRVPKEEAQREQAPARSKFLFEWRNAFCAVSDTSREMGLPALTRLILWTVSRLMNVDGTGARQGQARIAREAGVSLPAAKFHLRLAESRGWLKRELNVKSLHGIGFSYVAAIPKGATTLPPPGNDVAGSRGKDVAGSRGNDVAPTGQRG